MQESDAAIVARARGGDIDAFRSLVERHSRYLYGVVFRLTRNAEDTQDVVQDTWLKVHAQLGRFESRSEVRTWLTRIAVNTCRDRRRAGWWQRFRQWSDQLELVSLADRGLTPEDAAISSEERHRIWQAFRALPDRQREVFVLRHVEDWSGPEIAAALDLSEGTVKRHLFRAVHRMRGILGNAG